MKILFLTKELPYPVNNGHRMRSYHYIKGLLRNNKVLIVCFGDKEENKEGVEHFYSLGCGVEFVNSERLRKGPNKYLVALSSLLSQRPYAINLRYDKKMKQKVREVIKEKGIETIVCDGIHQALHVPFDNGCYKILDEHNVESTIIERFCKVEASPLKRVYAFLEYKKFKAFEERIWPVFNEIHTCSDVDKAQVEQRSGHKNVKVVANGVDLNKFKPSGREINPKRLVYSGLIGWKPNEDAVLYFVKEIYPFIKKEINDVEFFVVGKDPCEEIRGLSREDGSITVTGFVDDVVPYIEEGAVYVVPLRIGSGTRLKILEAMAMEKPVVSTSIGCEGIDVKDGEDIIISDDPKDFAQKVIELLNDSSKIGSIGKNGRMLVEREYSWEVIEGRINKLISS